MSPHTLSPAHVIDRVVVLTRLVCIIIRWDKQATVKRINESLLNRGFLTWFDLTNTKGSTMDAMR